MMNLDCGGLCNNVCGESNNENVDLNHLIGAEKEILCEALVSMGKKEDEVESFLEYNVSMEEDEVDLYDIERGKIKINSDGRITHLYLSNNKLKGLIPKGVSKLTNLTWLDLSFNKLEGPIPDGISKLTNLTWLDLQYNKLEGPIPEEVGNLFELGNFNISNNVGLHGNLPVLPAGCVTQLKGTSVSAVSVRTKILSSKACYMDYIMIVVYMILGIVDVVTDILSIIALFRQGRDAVAVLNAMFVGLGAVLGIVEDPSLENIFWNITYLGPIKEGMITLYTGRQTPGLVANKKLDAIARSMPSTVLQTFALLLDLNNFDQSTLITLVASIGFGLLGSAVTLSGLHPKAGHRLVSRQFSVIFCYYASELLFRSMLLAVMFLTIRAYAFIVVGLDFLFRWVYISDDAKMEADWLPQFNLDKILTISLSTLCLYMGSDNAIEGGYNGLSWITGFFINFVEMIIFVIILFTLDTADLHVLREDGIALHVTITMLVAGAVKFFQWFIINDMEAPKEDANADSAESADMFIEMANALA